MKVDSDWSGCDLIAETKAESIALEKLFRVITKRKKEITLHWDEKTHFNTLFLKDTERKI